MFTTCSHAGCSSARITLGTRSIPGLSVFAASSIMLAASEPGHVARAHPPTSPSRLRLALLQARELQARSVARSLCWSPCFRAPLACGSTTSSTASRPRRRGPPDHRGTCRRRPARSRLISERTRMGLVAASPPRRRDRPPARGDPATRPPGGPRSPPQRSRRRASIRRIAHDRTSPSGSSELGATSQKRGLDSRERFSGDPGGGAPLSCLNKRGQF